MTLVFVAAAAAAILGALGIIAARQPVHGVLALVLNFLGLAVIYVLLTAEFMAVIQLIVYAGAIMVLFLFVIALLTARKDPMEAPDSPLSNVWPALAGISVLGLLAGTVLWSYERQAAGVPEDFGTVKAFGHHLLTTHVLPFELTAFVLMVAVIGVVILVGRKTAE